MGGAGPAAAGVLSGGNSPVVISGPIKAKCFLFPQGQVWRFSRKH